MKQYAITTTDNPYDPFTQFKEWYLYDCEKGYDTCGILSRLATTNDELLTQQQNMDEEERAMRRMIALDLENKWTLISRDIPDQA